jgi:hypothetical protein
MGHVSRKKLVNRLRCLSNLLKSNNAINFQLLLNPNKNEENSVEEDFEKLFSIKNINEESENYPHNSTLAIRPKRLFFTKVQVVSMNDQEDVIP